MNMEWLLGFEDPYLKKPSGKGVFLAGVLLGFVASCQKDKGGHLNDAPLFKKLAFGKLQIRDVKRYLSELPMLLKAYDIPYQRQLVEISGAATEFLMQDDRPMGVDGNFVFTNAFLNAWKYFYQFYPALQNKETNEEETE
ncbi:MAG: TM1802 family CRISPR-associated protein [Chloroflexota bacterium]|nr:TM1802 family CRISPR-associated protein [Chloroflexota bacterium]